ncbi:hypothetical protein NNO07_24740, partial [Pseudomonas resinovorans]
CAALGERLPSEAELQTLFTTYTRANAVGEDSKEDIRHTYGWHGGGHVYWSTRAPDENRHSYVYLPTDGHSAGNSNTNRYMFACATAGQTEGLPTVTGVSIPDPSPGVPVTVAYTYNGNATIPDRSKFQWYTATSANGSGKVLISGATEKSYTPAVGDAGKWLVVEVTPASYDTVVGTPVTAISEQPVPVDMIGPVTIEKPTASRPSFQANYTFIEGTEAGSTYQWYWKGSAVAGATSKTFAFPSLTIPSATAAEELRVEVTPKSSTGQSGIKKSGTLGLRSSIAWNAPLGQSTWYDMAKACANQSNGNKRPGTVTELQTLVSELGNMQAYGVNVSSAYWTGTRGSQTGISYDDHSIVTLSNGVRDKTQDTNASVRGLCVAGSVSAPPLGGLKANGYTHPLNSGFPSTGFAGAQFAITGLESLAFVHTYRSLTPSVVKVVPLVNNVSFELLAKGNGSIEVYNGAGGNPALVSFNVNKWFREGGTRDSVWAAAGACGGSSTSILPTLAELTPAGYNQTPSSRRAGSLWGEWGDMSKFGWKFRGDSWYWTGQQGGTYYYDVSLASGKALSEPGGVDLNSVCISR